MPTADELREKYKALVAAKASRQLPADVIAVAAIAATMAKTEPAKHYIVKPVVRRAIAVLANYKPKQKADWMGLGDEELLEKAIEIIESAETTITEMPDFVSYVAANGHRCNVGCGNNGHGKDFWVCLDSIGSEWKRLDHLRSRLGID